MNLKIFILLYIIIGFSLFFLAQWMAKEQIEDEWRYSSIDFTDSDFEDSSLNAKKVLNFILAMIFKMCVLVPFWPLFALIFISGKVKNKAKKVKNFELTDYVDFES